MTTLAQVVQVGMETLQQLLVTFGPEIAVCIRGAHAVGKSEGTYQSAALMRDDFYKNQANAKKYNWRYDQGLPVVERRLSQLTEGDLTGMPDLGSDRKSTQFKPCDWLIDATERPVVLFLDERNRALEGVKQAVFQLMDSRAFYGYKLHPSTRVIVAENVGDLYNVQQCDPAEVSRAATVELKPSIEEWLKYASLPNKCHPMTVDFIRQNREFLEFDPDDQSKTKKVYESNKKYPDRRAWFKLDQQLQRSKLIETPSNPLFYTMVASMVGIEAALKFADFSKNYSRQVSVEEILTDWPKAKARLGSSATTPKYMEIIDGLKNHLKTKTISDAQAKQIGLFMADAPPEPRMVLWSELTKNTKNLFKVHKYVEELMLRTSTGQDVSEASVPEKEKNEIGLQVRRVEV